MDGIFDRRLRGLLNKITKESFTTISTQVVTPINGAESNAQTLLRVVRLVYEHGIDDVAFSDIYARLCRTIMEEISPNIADDSQDKPVAGGPLFRKYLLDHCQEQFERLWSTSDTSLVARHGDETLGGERFFSVEYYAAQKAKRQRRGLVRFVGELYKLQMLTDKVVHDRIMRFLKDDLPPGEEDIESVCMLLSVAGQSLDTKAPLHMNAYFERMGQLVKMELLSFRAKSLLMVSLPPILGEDNTDVVAGCDRASPTQLGGSECR